VLGTNSYYFFNAPFIPANPFGLLTIGSSAHSGGDATLLIDGLVLIKRSTADIVIANPSFEASGLNFGFPGYVETGGVGPDIAGWIKSGSGNIAINGTAAVFARFLSGSFSGVVGLPLFETAQMLRGFGWKLP